MLSDLDYLISRTFFAPVCMSCPVPGLTPELRRRSANQWAPVFGGFSGFLEWPYFGHQNLPENQVKLNKHAGRGASGIPQKQTNVQMGRGAGSPPGAAFHAAGSLPLGIRFPL